MRPKAQRIAIAEACGWKNVKPVIVRNVTKHGDDRFCGITSDDGWVPDYLNDLNAMHEAEKTITDWWAYSDHLQEITNTQKFHDQDLIQATAAQRAEAFLRTLGLWK